MAKETSHTRTLKRALKLAGTREGLADLLGADLSELSAWLSGERPTPAEIYLRALDLVSQGMLHKSFRNKTE
jgi:DNA-binding transcriptional regulator YdaS (Cro superfamily)